MEIETRKMTQEEFREFHENAQYAELLRQILGALPDSTHRLQRQVIQMTIDAWYSQHVDETGGREE